MSRSFVLFDAMFDMAHFLKLASYGLVFAGLAIDFYLLYSTAADQAEELRHSSQRLQLALDSAGAGIWTRDIQTKEYSWGERIEGVFGLEPGTFDRTNEAWVDLVHPKDLAGAEEAIDRAIAGDSRCEIKYRVRSKGGNWSHIVATGIVERDLDGKPVQMVGTCIDVSELKAAEDALRQLNRDLEKRVIERTEELERSNRELDDFAYIASHDLKEPLRGIHNYSKFLLEDYGDVLDEDGKSKLETLCRLTQRLESLINALLRYARVGRIDLDLETVDLNEVLQGVLDGLRFSLDDASAVLSLVSPLPVTRCDAIQTGEVLHNLISNAFKYNNEPHKTIEIGSEQRSTPDGKAEVAFFVRDNGIGIPEKHLEDVFGLFKRLHSQRMFGGGTGAGLTIVRKIVDRHGGSTWVESAEGQGSTFYFTLSKATGE